MREWYSKNLVPNPVSNPEIGLIKFSRKGLGKAISSDGLNPLKLQLFAAVRDILKNGEVIRREDNHDRNTLPDIVAYHWIEAPVEVGGVTHRANVTVREHRNGKLYYNHNLSDVYKPAQYQAPTPGGPPGKK